jgi:hypothetical protein
MRRMAVALGMLGLICAAAGPSRAQKQIKIFGQNYNVVAQSRAGKFKNGVEIHLDSGANGVNNFAGVHFSQGKDPSDDRLWFACRIYNNDAGKGDQLYYLEGSDATGMFTPAVSNAKSFFGGNQDRTHGRRPVTVLEINRDDTGKKKDRNVIACTFYDDDSVRMWDLDTMDGFGGGPGDNDVPATHDSDALFQRPHPGQSVSANDAGSIEADEHLPTGSYPSFAHLPKPDGHTILYAAGPSGDNSDTEIGLWDTQKNDAYDALTDIGEQTKTAAKPFPVQDADGNALGCMSMVRVGDQGEYWFLLKNPPGPGDSTPNDDVTAVVLVRAKLEVPADPSKAKPGDVKVTVMDTQDLKATGADILYKTGTSGITGLAVGREATAGGPRVLYTTDYDGNVYTLTPAQ